MIVRHEIERLLVEAIESAIDAGELPGRMEAGIIIGEPTEGDWEAFFGPIRDDDVMIQLPAGEMLWANLLAGLGIFSSRSQARKAGWNKQVPPGFSDVTIGKLRHQVSVLRLV